MRTAEITRRTKETDVRVKINLDGTGKVKAETGIKFFDHLLESMCKHGRIDLDARARGDFPHHTAEDTMIVLGEAVNKALGKKRGIARMGDAIVPMDDTLVMAAVDLSGRAFPDIRASFSKKKIEDMSSDLIIHLLQTLAVSGRMNLHVQVMRGDNDHHKAEAIFKAVGVALSRAVARTRGKGVPSTKGAI
ncbi:MAG: imidazoleglycerol-phosphate dehydratase HisB [Candidatus Hadarchaeales archaeon]